MATPDDREATRTRRFCIRQPGGLNFRAVMQMKALAAENLRLRRLVSSLFACLRAESETREPDVTLPKIRDKVREQRRAIGIAAEKCGGALTGRFASVRVNP
jgi:putative transposase